MADLTQSTGGQGPRRLGERLKLLNSPITVIVAVFAAVLIFDTANTGDIATIASGALVNTAPYILFAVLLLAFLKATGAEVLISRAFEGRETRMIFLAAIFGGLAPFCSCEVIPFIAGLLALGTPLSAVMAFWLSSPLIDPPTLLITAGALGWPFAIGKAVSAVGLGILGGFAMRWLMRTGAFADPLRSYQKSGCGCGTKKNGKPQWQFWTEPDRRDEFRSQFVTNGIFLLKWLALAYTLEAVMIEYVPADLIARVVGGEGILPVITAALVGMPAYLNGYVAPPLLAGLMTQGMTAGAAMAFMVAGAVSSIPAMAAVWSLVKPQVFAAYLGLGLLGAVLAGVIFQAIV
ncbi:permease [Chachezhania antarctica]|uniref:permease n=1 Tax=Chachezhania antarctica TaxID=2340860 RepID=UPI000EADF11A|nr:permease [Chachezhania antarctica]|tara:strand:+ start:6414 stop:7457 length:1044 start_codon:yes stop_codon:yes gene_type:complete